MTTKDLSFKNFPGNDENSTLFGGSFVNPNDTSRTNLFSLQDSDLRIQMIRQKYDSPGMNKSLKFSQFSSEDANSSKVMEQSFAIRKECFVNQQQSRKVAHEDKGYQKDQEEVLMKIKNMKQSLLSDRMRTSNLYGRLNSEKQRNQKYQQHSGLTQGETRNRQDNIDKINFKIKQILSCLQENQKYHQNKLGHRINDSQKPRGQFESKNKTFDHQPYFKYQRQPMRLRGDDKQNVDTKVTKERLITLGNQTVNCKQKFAQRHQANKSQQLINKSFQNQSFNKVEPTGKADKPLREVLRSKSYVQIKYGNANKRSSILQDESKKSEKLDGRIQSIQRKIRQSQQTKKQLNIDFKPFVYERKGKAETRIEAQTFHIGRERSLNHFASRHNLVTSDNVSTESNNKHAKVQPDSTNKSSIVATLKSKDIAVNEFKLKMVHQDSHEKSVQLYARQIQLRNSIDNNQQQRRRKLSNIPQKAEKCEEIIKLVDLLSRQVDLDQSLRNGKCWLQNQLDQDKWKSLRTHLHKMDILLDQEQIKKVFSPSEEQNNPFFSIRQCNQKQSNLLSLAQNYKLCEDHWNHNIKGKIFDSKKDYTHAIAQIDLENKNFIILEDLVRFLNMETSKFYRNRDLILIFRRISTEKNLQHIKFIKLFTKSN